VRIKPAGVRAAPRAGIYARERLGAELPLVHLPRVRCPFDC